MNTITNLDTLRAYHRAANAARDRLQTKPAVSLGDQKRACLVIKRITDIKAARINSSSN